MKREDIYEYVKKRYGTCLLYTSALSLIGCANSNNETPAETPTANKTETLATSEKTMTIGLIPVSYTHLDVYKRQVP